MVSNLPKQDIQGCGRISRRLYDNILSGQLRIVGNCEPRSTVVEDVTKSKD